MRRFLMLGAAVAALLSTTLQAQGRQGPPPAAPQGRAGAPFDITGYWVALVTDDWR